MESNNKRDVFFSSNGTQVSLNSLPTTYVGSQEYSINGDGTGNTYTGSPSLIWTTSPTDDSGISPFVIPGTVQPTITKPDIDIREFFERHKKGDKEAQIEIRPAPTVADLLVEIALLGNVDVNDVFDKYGVKIVDREGNVIYDAEKKEQDIASKSL